MATESNCVNEKGGPCFGFPVINGEFLKNLVAVKLAYPAQLLGRGQGLPCSFLQKWPQATGKNCVMRVIKSDL